MNNASNKDLSDLLRARRLRPIADRAAAVAEKGTAAEETTPAFDFDKFRRVLVDFLMEIYEVPVSEREAFGEQVYAQTTARLRGAQ